MASTLRDELASLKIDRRNGSTEKRPAPRSSGNGGLGFISFLLWMIPISLLGFAGYYGYSQYEKVRSKPEVQVGMVQTMTSGEAEKLLTAKGYLKSRYQSRIGTRIPGRVEKMLVEEGTRVKKGQILAILEHNDLKAMLQSRQSQVARGEAELKEARVDLAEKEREATRAKALHGRKMLSIEEYQKADALRGIAEAKIAGLEANIAWQKANVAETEANIRYMSLYAPFDGTIVEKEGEEGEIINPMSMGGTAAGRSSIGTLANLEKMEVETDVSENLLSRIAIGQPAEVSVSAVPSKHYRGRLRQIVPLGDRTRGTVKVKVEILDPDSSLFPELVATVHFLPDKALQNPNANKSFVFVPKSAIFENNGHSYAWVLDTNSRITRKQVEVATTNDELARVESGLRPGETVVVSPAKTLHENETVKVAE